MSIGHRCPHIPLFCQSTDIQQNSMTDRQRKSTWLPLPLNGWGIKMTSIFFQFWHLDFFQLLSCKNLKSKFYILKYALMLLRDHILSSFKENKTSKTQDAQLPMLTNISVKFHDSRSNTFLVTHDTSWKFFTKSRKILNKSTRETPMCTNTHADQHSCIVCLL
jgi:hypothetical protein